MDVLINNAGTMSLGRVAVIDQAHWWRDFEVDVRATMSWCRAVLGSMIDRGEGVIVNVTSTAFKWTIPAGSAYIASKSAVNAFTRVLAAEVAGSGVRVFAFAPWARTDMTEALRVSPAFTDQERATFAPIDDAEAERRLNGTQRMLRQMLAGGLDDHVGSFLDSDEPPR